ncbi:hypothetical protein FJTKL_02070 [Diaporthe vaccinii]|uniref:Uncharacterized protein n=1 Tax=Diaporthe vaccinii TaxID=105482 RepID=A0ABR4DZ93_9PEZI
MAKRVIRWHEGGWAQGQNGHIYAATPHSTRQMRRAHDNRSLTISVSSATPGCRAAGMHACIVAHDIPYTLVGKENEKRWLM